MTVVAQHKAEDSVNLSFTEAAVNYLLSYLKKDSKYIGIRLAVKKTGCSGYAYALDYVDTANDNDLVLPLQEPYHVYIDRVSYPLIKNMTVDYVRQGLNAKLMFSNPNQTGQCGCGESFTVL